MVVAHERWMLCFEGSVEAVMQRCAILDVVLPPVFTNRVEDLGKLGHSVRKRLDVAGGN